MSKFVEIVGQGINTMINVDEIKEIDFTLTGEVGGVTYTGARIVLQHPQAIGMGMFNYDIFFPDKVAASLVASNLRLALQESSDMGIRLINLPGIPAAPENEMGLDGPH